MPAAKVQGSRSDLILKGGPRLERLHDACDAWAIIVCGYNDLPDTFDEDTDGIYTVMTGLGIANTHIFFVSPHTTHPGVDQPTSIANVQWAINQVATQADVTDKVLFFYSSHGGVDSLSCVPTSPGGGSITAANLDTWLDAIACDELTIVIEACHSGSLIGTYADGTYVAAEDDLTGDGETNRCIFTFASTDTSSYPDVDGAGDPNPADVGSETIWGYVEAFSTAAADTTGDGEISFGEGWQYAWNNDVTRITGDNTPQMRHSGLVANRVFNYCYRVTGKGDLFISDGPADVGHNSQDYCSTDIWVTQNLADTVHRDTVSGMDNYVHVAVHNRGTTPVANTSLKVYWADSSTATSWPADFHQIGAAHVFPALAAGATDTHTWTWFVDPALGLGHHFCLVAVADSPDDPSTGGPPGVTYVAPYDNNIGQINITIVEDPGHAHSTFAFVLRNNTREAQAVDLVAEWIGNPWGTVVLALPEDILKLAGTGAIKTENLKRVARQGEVPAGLQIGKEAAARVRNIPLKPGESRTVTVVMSAAKRQPGREHELVLRQEAKGTVLGTLTARLRQVPPDDCGWVLRHSVEVFADVAHQLKIEAATDISKLFARGLAADVCRDEKALLELLSQAATRQAAAAKALPWTRNQKASSKFQAALKELNRAVKAKNTRAALASQGAISEAVKDLLPGVAR